MTNNTQEMAATSPSKPLSREGLKLLLMALMVLDHIYFFISPYLADTFHLLTRVVAVGFGYLLVEGMHYTRSRPKYLLRLVGWAGIMALGNHLLNLLILAPGYQLSVIGDNIFLTLAIGALIIILWDNRQTNAKRRLSLRILAGLLVLLSLLPIVEGGFVVISFIFMTLLTYQQPKKRNITYLCFALLLAAIELPMALASGPSGPLAIFDSIAMNASDPFFILIIFVLHFYNGQLSPYSAKLKYLFYLFYPAHLWLIHLIANQVAAG